MKNALCALLVLVLTAPLAAPLAAGELAGVTLSDTAQAGDQQLVLNGMALRKKFFIKVYVAGLYLPSRQSDAEAILAADAPRHLVMHFLYGVSAGQMCDAWNESLEANNASPSPTLLQQYETLCRWMADVEKGEQYTFTYLPGEGTTVVVKGQTQGTIEGKEFADNLFNSWIGPKPGPGGGFKDDLLGK